LSTPRLTVLADAIRRRPRSAAFAMFVLAFAVGVIVGAFPAPLLAGAPEAAWALAAVAVLPSPRSWVRVRKLLLRFRRRAGADLHVLLALGLVGTVLLVDLVGNPTNFGRVLLLSAVFVGVQVAVANVVRHAPKRTLDLPRLLLALAYVGVAAELSGVAGVPPLTTLYAPIIAMAATLSGRAAAVVAAAACAAYLVPAIVEPATEFVRERAIALAVTGIVLGFGTRRTIVSLERTLGHLRSARGAERRRSRQVAGVDEVGRMLAASGATAEALERTVDLLVERFGYRYVSIYTGDGSSVRLGAQRGYHNPIQVIDASRGVVGRVMRTGRPVFVADVSDDPDYMAGADEIVSEVSVPLVVHGEPFGVLSVEGTREAPVDGSDLETTSLIADRLASALALSRERSELARRVRMLEGLTAFSARMTATLAPADLYQVIVRLVHEVIPCDSVTLTVRDEASGEYRIGATIGWDQAVVGLRVLPGEGLTGRAIAENRVVIESHHRRESWPAALRISSGPDVVAVAATPLARDEEVVGALALSRNDVDKPLDAAELEVLSLIGSQAALAVTNAGLHAAALEASIRDPLTAVFNRRHLDASIERLFAARARLDQADRRPLAVILFDLDEFGAFNKRHGHQLGDDVLRAFAGILRDRFRSSDIVARYGGEEFVVILDGASRDEAVRLADDIRNAFADLRFTGSDGRSLAATVSAGCAGVEAGLATAEALLAAADVGLAMAKQAGRNQVVAA
jgi:diguanylate cyclase (GGDEF)-like protein